MTPSPARSRSQIHQKFVGIIEIFKKYSALDHTGKVGHLPCRPDNKDQCWLEILVRVDKGQLLVWVGSGQQCRVSAILNSARSGYIGVRGSTLL
jgi:hypothetical protein